MHNRRTRVRTAALLSLANVVMLGTPAANAGAGNVTDERLATDTTGESWLVKGGSLAQMQYSPLRDITDRNVSRLGLAWLTEFASPMGITAEPIVVDGVIYLSAPRSVVYAIQLRFQPIDATHWAKRSAGVSKPSVCRGRSFSRRAMLLSLFW